MAMPATIRRWTKKRVLALPPAYGTRFEVVAGELLVTPMPPPEHQRILGQFLWVLARYLTPLGLAGTVLPGPADISWSDDDLVRPDLFVVDPADRSVDWATFKRFRMVIEVLSWPSSRRAARCSAWPWMWGPPNWRPIWLTWKTAKQWPKQGQ